MGKFPMETLEKTSGLRVGRKKKAFLDGHLGSHVPDVGRGGQKTTSQHMAFQLQYVDTGDEDAVKKVDVSTLTKSANGASCNSVSLLECWWIIQGMTVMVEADASTDVIMMHMAADDIGYQDFSKFGGLPSTVEYGSTTGDVLFTTTGLGAAGDTYNIVMRMKKHYA